MSSHSCVKTHPCIREHVNHARAESGSDGCIYCIPTLLQGIDANVRTSLVLRGDGPMVGFNEVRWVSMLGIRQILCGTVPMSVSENYKKQKDEKGDLADASSVLVRDRAGRGISQG